ncbi:NAD(P)-binding domain-containing protein [Caballeronia sp. LZ034LL]|uniref:NADPH-dependent F420 reductase n=1 Tax=Caballeronia sp. LZ034LL TaxID=3038567 RepID=UPI00285576CD|nr:NAD(P)-binding domain-containing protein [Caballeronia sp. LZ034LL]MDR5836122.1 NAD(P)-binding domain-containing protein [Caballeronia sp. LZ034LL]
MKITVVGYGNVGAAMVKQLEAAGHDVQVTGRKLEGAEKVAQQSGATSASLAAAAKDAELVVLAVPYGNAAAALAELGPLDGKVLVDVTNPLTDDYMGLTIGHSTSAAEEIAKLTGASVVKAFNTLFAQVLDGGAAYPSQAASVFVASDDAGAKQKVAAAAESMGFDVIDAGGLKNARYLEAVAGLNIYLGYGAGLGVQIAPTWIKR